MRYLPFLLTLALAPGCQDPTHDNAVDALGGEAPGIPKGPLHRAGQPCLTCHGGEGPANTEFSVAGTVYLLSYQDTVAPGTTVLVEDSTGVAGNVVTNAAGSFFINGNDWHPVFPLQVTLTYGNITKQMPVQIGRAGSCADCHLAGSRGGPNTPGRIWIALNQSKLAQATQPAQ
ncbi:MAG TPA: hypothetical protein VH062_16360 [Polyangiaceae bacterium]|jgi:hypothetical protein|nr:hypothetical protein [Polyangiaceae bacterium]